MDIVGFVADNMGHFAPLDIALLLFQVLLAALLGYLIARFGTRADGDAARELMLWAASAALAAGLVRTQLPLAVMLLAFVVLVKGGDASGRERISRFIALVLGLGCGSGAGLVTAAVAVPFIIVVRMAFPGQRP